MFYSNSCIINSMVTELLLQEEAFCTTQLWPYGLLQNCTAGCILKTIKLPLKDRTLYW